jgi:hypothetical protein
VCHFPLDPILQGSIYTVQRRVSNPFRPGACATIVTDEMNPRSSNAPSEDHSRRSATMTPAGSIAREIREIRETRLG